jgi:hypothetical protein
LVVGNAEVDAHECRTATALQLTQPLMREVEVTCDGDGEDPSGGCADRTARAADAVPPDSGECGFRRYVDEHRHTLYERHNARHHPPRGPVDLLDSRRVPGRVHAVVRRASPYTVRLLSILLHL